MNGWCITFNGYRNNVCYGWYSNDLRHGNFWSIQQPDSSLWTTDNEETGFYKYDQRVGGIDEDHHQYPVCGIKQVFVDPPDPSKQRPALEVVNPATKQSENTKIINRALVASGVVDRIKKVKPRSK